MPSPPPAAPALSATPLLVCAGLIVTLSMGIRHGFGLWALERKDSGAFIGYCGLVWAPSSVPGCG